MSLMLAVLIIGLSGIVAQIVILRELLVVFYGNELIIGIILANWMVSEAFGVFVVGKLVDKIKSKLSVFICLNSLFALFLPGMLFICRIFKSSAGIPFAEALSLPLMALVSLLIIFPLAFLHGGLFSCGCKMYFLQNPEDSLGKVYTWETVGTIMGGLVLTYFLIPNFNSFQSVLALSFLNLILVFLFLANRKLRYFLILLVTLIFALCAPRFSKLLQESSIRQQWEGQVVLDNRNSDYANISVTKKLNQYTFFYNGVPVIVTPYPDRQFVAELGNFAYLFNPKSKRVLVAGSGSGGLIAEILRYPLSNLDYVEIDPLIIGMLRKYPTAITEKELSDKRVRVFNNDPRFFLRNVNTHYDCILLGLSEQSDLSTNRFFTKEFFGLARNKLNPGGIFVMWMPGSLTYMSQELKDLNRCVLNGLGSAYKYVRIIPGDYNIFIASDSSGIMRLTARSLYEEMANNSVDPGILVPEYLEYRLNRQWLDWFNKELLTTASDINQDLRPVAVFQRLRIENRKFSPQLDFIFSSFKNVRLGFLLVIIVSIVSVTFILIKNRLIPAAPLAYAIFTTGFFGMTVNLLLVFAYQVFYGYLFRKISVLTAIFMAGIALGSLLMVKGQAKINKPRGILIRLEIIIAVFVLILGAAIVRFPGFLSSLEFIFYMLFFISGIFMGLEFPLAARLYPAAKDSIGATSGVLYASDLIGGWLAGIFTGVLFLPVLGLFKTCVLIFAFKLSSLFLLILTNKDQG
jgi:spermidine synthase